LRHFERLVIEGLGLDRHPELFPSYFGHYKKLVYLAQSPKTGAMDQAKAVASRMGLAFEYRQTGYGTLETSLKSAVEHDGARRDELRRDTETVTWQR
jgi:hypothetical protein